MDFDPENPLVLKTVWDQYPIPAKMDYHTAVDRLEEEILDTATLVEPNYDHLFTEGLYIRTMAMPKGCIVTTKIHKTQHPFVVIRGSVSVYTPEGGVVHIQAPYVGVTEPGTRRVAIVHEDTVWITFHTNPTNDTNLESLEERLVEARLLRDGKTAGQLFVAKLAAAALEGGS